MFLFPGQKQHAGPTATLLPDGRLDINGAVLSSPSEAAKAIVGGAMNGWWFFLVDPQTRRSLKDVRLEYLESIAADSDDDDDDEDSEDEA